ncbi:DMT family transporter [Pelagibius sp. Alg239-R121]|uniref:DMT family transporter n=1 Tax=Pelagibius sp. Alg239-R121 TaxID=2993448 RepID=UPI0024A79549|nr:DMT family transporter [Pelagibius sp. Alg239-R121]
MSAHTELRHDNIKLAVTVIVLTVLALSLGDAVIKKASANMVLWQIFVLRSLLAIPLLLLLMRTRFASVPLRLRASGWTAVRSLMLTLMWVAYYASLPHLQLSIAAAAYYTLPIFITLFSAFFVGEKVRALGWFAIVLGFCGVTLILKPAADDFNLYALMPLMSAMLYALAMILTRTKCRDEHPLMLSAALNVTFIAVGLAATLLIEVVNPLEASSSFLLAGWAPMATNEFVAIILLAIAILVGSIGTAVAYQAGPSSVVATFDFAYVGFAVIWGFIFFGEVPDAVTVCGLIIIVISGVIAVRR